MAILEGNRRDEEMKEVKNVYLPTDCRFCREHDYPPEGMTTQCKHCGGIFCFGHMNPDIHNCTYIIKGRVVSTSNSKKIEGGN